MVIKRIVKTVALSLCVALLAATLFGCSKEAPVIISIELNNEISDWALYDLDDSAKDGRYKATAEELASLSSMGKKLSNDYLELYMGSNYDIAVLDKETGAVYFSNCGIYDESINKSANKAILADAFSQVSIVYYDTSNNKRTMTSYPDCVSEKKNQVTVNVKKDQLEVIYEFDVNRDEMLICPVLTEKSFNLLKEKAEKLIAEEKLDEISHIRFLETYSRIVYDELDKVNKNDYEDRYPHFEDLGVLYVLSDEISQAQINNNIEVSKILGIDKEFLKTEEKNYGGGESNVLSTPYFKIPVIYSLQGRDIIVSINASEIVCAEDYYLTRISLLNNFGATKQSENGYTFVPDRSGAIICNDIESPNISSMDFPFYGTDFGKEIINSRKISPYTPFPVFGVYNGVKSVFGIVESGDALGGITAQTPTKEFMYNSVYPWFNYYEQDFQNVYAVKNTDSNTEDISGTSYIYSEQTPTCAYRVRYHFLYGDKATYSGMATYYQNYLVKKDALKDRTENEALLLDLNVIGAITKKTFKYLVPVETVVAASEFKDVEALTKRLTNGGIDNLNLIYQGCINGGMDFKVPTKINIEKSLGSKNDYKSLCNTLSDNEQKLLPMIDFAKVFENGNGLDKHTQISRYLNQKVAYYSDYMPSDLSRDSKRISYLINPYSYSEIIEKFIENSKDLKTKSVFVSTVGSYLSGNYDDKYQIDREEAKFLTQNALKELDSDGYALSFDGCNEYILEYAHSISNVPVSSGNYNIESYSVPFVGMVLHGYIPYSGCQLNQQANYQNALLQTIESGAGLNYIIMTESSMLLQDTAYSDYYSVDISEWETEIIDKYNELNKIFKSLANSTIVQHSRVKDGVFVTVYSNGTKIYVNYNRSSVTVDEGAVEAMNYLLVK